VPHQHQCKVHSTSSTKIVSCQCHSCDRTFPAAPHEHRTKMYPCTPSLSRDRIKGYVHPFIVNITPFGMPISCRRRLKDPETPCLVNQACLHLRKDGLLELTLNLDCVRKVRPKVGVDKRHTFWPESSWLDSPWSPRRAPRSNLGALRSLTFRTWTCCQISRVPPLY
jgi:hypothetical protein